MLPCGAGKTLVGITATATIGRSCLVLCNSAVSVEQWYQQFLLWTTLPKDRIVRFTAATKEKPHPEACVVVSTYNMISFSGRRSKEALEVRGAEGRVGGAGWEGIGVRTGLWGRRAWCPRRI